MATDTTAAYPVSVEGEVDPDLGRWLWLLLFKLPLVIPHLVILDSLVKTRFEEVPAL